MTKSNAPFLIHPTRMPLSELHYQIAYKSVGNFSMFDRADVRKQLVAHLEELAMTVNATVFDIQVFNYGVSFKISVPRTVDIMSFLRLVGRSLLQDINKTFPELHLKKMAPSHSLSRLWHRPYYISTLTPPNVMPLTHYLK